MNKEEKIIEEIKNYEWSYRSGDGFYEDNLLYNFRQMYEAVKKIKEWQFKLHSKDE